MKTIMKTIMNNKMRIGKKGQELIVDFWTIIGFMIVAFIIFVIFFVNKDSHQNAVSAEFANNDVNIMLTSFLNSRLDYQKNDQTIAEIMVHDSLVYTDFPQTSEIF